VPQVFDWGAYRKGAAREKTRAPTLAEMRAMAWQCVAAGANGLVFYSFFDLFAMSDRDPFERRWSDVCAMGEEIKRYLPIMLSVETLPQLACRVLRCGNARVARGVASLPAGGERRHGDGRCRDHDHGRIFRASGGVRSDTSGFGRRSAGVPSRSTRSGDGAGDAAFTIGGFPFEAARDGGTDLIEGVQFMQASAHIGCAFESVQIAEEVASEGCGQCFLRPGRIVGQSVTCANMFDQFELCRYVSL
jgi:hypothetical protein